MPKRWIRFTNPVQGELIAWFRSEDAGSLCCGRLHSVAENALIDFHSQFADPFPRIESHGEYILGMFAAPTSVQDKLADFLTIYFLADFEQIVTVLRSSETSELPTTRFAIAVVEEQIAKTAELFDGSDWSVGMGIARVAEVFVTQIEQSLELFKMNVDSDLKLVTAENFKIASTSDPDYLSELYRRTTAHEREVVSLKTLLEETKNIFKAVASDEVDIKRTANNENEELFPQSVEVSIADLLMRARRLTSVHSNLESGIEFLFRRFQEIERSQQTAVGRRFTAVVSVLLLPQLIAAYFGQNFDETPGYQHDFGWAYSLLLIIVASAVQIVWLKKKKYLWEAIWNF